MPAASRGIARAVPTQPIYLVASTYGTVTCTPGPSSAETWFDSRTRLWLTVPSTDPDGMRSPEVTMAHNDATGHTEYIPFVDARVARAEIRRGRWEVWGRAGWKITMVQAPCVCGAGQVGHAPITRNRHHVVMMRHDLEAISEWYTQIP